MEIVKSLGTSGPETSPRIRSRFRLTLHSLYRRCGVTSPGSLFAVSPRARAGFHRLYKNGIVSAARRERSENPDSMRDFCLASSMVKAHVAFRTLEPEAKLNKIPLRKLTLTSRRDIYSPTPTAKFSRCEVRTMHYCTYRKASLSPLTRLRWHSSRESALGSPRSSMGSTCESTVAYAPNSTVFPRVRYSGTTTKTPTMERMNSWKEVPQIASAAAGRDNVRKQRADEEMNTSVYCRPITKGTIVVRTRQGRVIN